MVIRVTAFESAYRQKSFLVSYLSLRLSSGEASERTCRLYGVLMHAPALHTDNIEPHDVIGLKCLSEFRQWLNKWKRMPTENVPSTLLSSLQQRDCRQVFPILYALLNIAVVIPVSTATPERTFSALRLLKTYLRNRSSESRLNGLALM